MHSLKTSDVKMYDCKCVLNFSSVFKTTKPCVHTEPAEIRAFAKNENLCPVRHLNQYIETTTPLRNGNQEQLFISFVKPHVPVGKQTFARWVKEVLSRSGIDTTKYTAHSTRVASYSAAAKAGDSLKTILKAAGWSNEKIFTRFYKRHSSTTFSQKVMDGFVDYKK